MYPNIALTSPLRAGKDTVAAYLTEKYGYTRFAFGDELKRLAYDIFDVDVGVKDRALLQWFGQTMRQRDPDVWVRKCFENIAWDEDANAAVISDLRQPNEYTRCRSEGYVIIRVKALSALRIQRAVESADTFTYADLTHDTESHTDGFAVDYEVVNDGTLDELYAQVDAIMARIDAKRDAQ